MRFAAVGTVVDVTIDPVVNARVHAPPLTDWSTPMPVGTPFGEEWFTQATVTCESLTHVAVTPVGCPGGTVIVESVSVRLPVDVGPPMPPVPVAAIDPETVTDPVPFAAWLTVNVASRLEGMNKEFGTTILASAAIRDQAAEDFDFRALGQAQPKGRTGAIDIFELVGERAR